MEEMLVVAKQTALTATVEVTEVQELAEPASNAMRKATSLENAQPEAFKAREKA